MKLYSFKLANHSLFYGLANIANLAAAFVLIPIYTNKLPQEDVGLLSLFNNSITFLLYLFDFGIVNSLARIYYDIDEEDTYEKKKLFSTVYFTFFFLFIISLMFILMFNNKLNYFIFGSGYKFNLIFFAVIIAFLNIIFTIPLNYFRLTYKALYYFIYQLTKNLLMVTIISYLIVYQGYKIDGVVWGTLISIFFVTFLSVIVCKKLVILEFSKEYLFKLLKIGIPFWPTMILTWLIDYSSYYFLKHYLSEKEVAVYWLGHKIALIIYYFSVTFGTAWMPVLFDILKNEKEPKIVIGNLFTLYYSILLFLLLGLVFYSKILLNILGNENYFEITVFIPILSGAYLLYGIYFFLLSGLIIEKKFHYQTLSLLFGAGINIVLNFFLIPNLSYLGCGISLFTGYLTTVIFIFLFSQKYYNIYYQYGKLISITSIGILIFLLYYFSSAVFLDNIFLGIFFLILFLSLLVLLKLIPGKNYLLKSTKWL